MESILNMEIWYDAETKHLYINDELIGRCNEKQALEEIQEYFTKSLAKIKIKNIFDMVCR